MTTIIITAQRQKFPLGTLVTTQGAASLLTAEDIASIINRHSQGNWGEVCKEDAQENELSLKQGFRLLSVYTIKGQKFWVITEADRSVTTILLPDEY